MGQFSDALLKLARAKIARKVKAEKRRERQPEQSAAPSAAASFLGAAIGSLICAIFGGSGTKTGSRQADSPNRSAASGYACEVVTGHCRWCGSALYTDAPVCPNCGRDR